MEDNTNKEKVMTKYDKKMQARREAEQREKKQRLITRIVVAAIAVCIIAVVALTPIIKKQAAKSTFITVGEHEVSQIEYEYYYYTVLNQFLTQYSGLLPYIGLDTTQSLASQQYSDTMTWQDYFTQMALNVLVEYKALSDDASKTGFAYDVTEDYNTFITSVKESAAEEDMSEKEYFKAAFGTYASEKTLKPYIEEYLLGQAYFKQLLADSTPTEEEITAYYEENKNNYDTVDYRIFTFAADVAEDADNDAVNAAMAAVKTQADEMAARTNAGEAFADLCIEYATEDAKTTYEESDASLKEDASYSAVNSSCREWLFDEARTANEVTVIESKTESAYYVVSFLERSFDEAKRETISSTIANDEASAYVTALTEAYTVKNADGEDIFSNTDTAEE